MPTDLLVDRIDALLPQTQCTKCGHEGCRPYAQAIADGEAINRCPPGGDEGIQALARLLERPLLSLDETRGRPGPLTVAVIDETHCIGCTLCIAACPVDAIVGAAKRMHTVLEGACTGCDLCLAPCPVDCIAMVPASRAWTEDDARAARIRHVARNARLHGTALPAGAQPQLQPQLHAGAAPADASAAARTAPALAGSAPADPAWAATAKEASAQGGASARTFAPGNAASATAAGGDAEGRKRAAIEDALARARARRARPQR